MKNGKILIFLVLSPLLLHGQTKPIIAVTPAENLSTPGNLIEMNLGGGDSPGNDMMVRYRLNQIHKIAGYSTLALGLLTGLTAPDDDDGGEGDGNPALHKALGISTGAMSAVTMGLGYAAHRGEVRTGALSVIDGVHIALGIAGGAMMVAAPIVAPGDPHSKLGIAGGVAMAVAVGWEFFL
ncbi:MAG: hypothetical protein JXA95_04995 [Spirochaetales bacterium]|nr:hypothetical protein [Spirochaetales bacterium]